MTEVVTGPEALARYKQEAADYVTNTLIRRYRKLKEAS